MNYNEQTRELTSITGYIKCIISEYAVYTSPMYLGIYDNPDNYATATEEEYLEYIEPEPEPEPIEE